MRKVIHTWIERYFADEEPVLLGVLLAVGLLVIVTMGVTLAPVITAVVIAFLMQGMVGRMVKLGLPFLASVSIATLMLIGCLIAGFLLVLPVVWQQSVNLLSELPRMLMEGKHLLMLLPERYPALVRSEQIEDIIVVAGRELGNFGQTILSTSLSSLPVLFGVLLYLFIVPLLVFFFLKDSREILEWMASFLPKERPTMRVIWSEMNVQVANYVRGKAIEIIVVTITSFVAFTLLDLNYAMLLAVAVGLSVIIPYIGAVVVTVPVAMIGIFQWGLGPEFMWLMIIYLVIQTIDGNVLVPLLFSEAVSLHPVAIIMAVLVFGSFWGVLGAFFAIPLATLVKAILSSWPTRESLTVNNY